MMQIKEQLVYFKSEARSYIYLQRLKVQLEEEIEEDGKMWYVGHSREYVRAVIEKTEVHQVNDLVEAKVTGFVTDHLLRAE